MTYKLIYCNEHSEKYTPDTWVELMGEGCYAITQTLAYNKKETRTVYLTRQQIEEILKEQEVNPNSPDR